jgi:hypothetical protein
MRFNVQEFGAEPAIGKNGGEAPALHPLAKTRNMKLGAVSDAVSADRTNSPFTVLPS